MEKWKSEIFKNNNIKLMKFHISLSFLYIVISALFGLAYIQQKASIISLVMAPCLLIAGLHIALAYGSKHKIEKSRKLSELLGAILMLGFPVGTIIGYFLVQTTLWRDPEKHDVQSPS